VKGIADFAGVSPPAVTATFTIVPASSGGATVRRLQASDTVKVDYKIALQDETKAKSLSQKFSAPNAVTSMTTSIAKSVDDAVGSGVFAPVVTALPAPSVAIIPGLTPKPGPPGTDDDGGSTAVAVGLIAGFIAAFGGTALILLALRRSGWRPGGKHAKESEYVPPAQREFDNVESAGNLGPVVQGRAISRESREADANATASGIGVGPHSPGSPSPITSAGPFAPGNAWALAVQSAEEAQEEPCTEKPYTGVLLDDDAIERADTQVPFDQGDDTWTGYSGAQPSGYIDYVSPQAETTSIVPARDINATWNIDAMQGSAQREDPGPTFAGDTTLSRTEDTWRLAGDEQPHPPTESTRLDVHMPLTPSPMEQAQTPRATAAVAQPSMQPRNMPLDFQGHALDSEVIMQSDFSPVMEHNR